MASLSQSGVHCDPCKCDEGEEEEEEGAKDTARLTAGGSPKSRDPPTSRKQMRKLGEPRRKICRIEEEHQPENSPSQRGNSPTWPPPRAEGPPVRRLTSPTTPDGNKRQGARKRKEEQRTKRELKAKLRKEKAALKEKKRKEQEDMLRRKGEKRTKNQPKILAWFRRKDEGQQKTRTGGKQGVG